MQMICPHCGKPYVKVVHRATGTKEERFMHFVQKMPNGCWLWTGGHGKRGYPHFNYETKTLYAHRVSWELFKGPIPEGLHVLHNCPTGDNKTCVNPEHLFLGTHVDNMADMARKGRRRVYGTKVHTCKLSEQDVLSIRSRFTTGSRQIDLALEYGVTPMTICNIVKGRIWQHLLPGVKQNDHEQFYKV